MSGGGGGGGGRDDGYQAPRPAKPTSPITSDGGVIGGVEGGGGSGGAGGPEGDACDIVQTAALNSPQPSVVARLGAGDRLDVMLGGTPARPILEVRDASGAVAGSLTHRGHVAIIDCINRGHDYLAVVVEKSGGMVTVRVQRR